MLLTPRIIRTHEYTARDLSPIYVGTNQNFGLTGPPPLIAAPPVEPDTDASHLEPRRPRQRAAARAACPDSARTRAGVAWAHQRRHRQPAAAGSGCHRSPIHGAARPDGADDDDAAPPGADFRDRAGRRRARRSRTLHGADLREQRVARVDGHA